MRFQLARLQCRAVNEALVCPSCGFLPSINSLPVLLSDFHVATGDFVADNIDAAAPPQVGRLDLICRLGSSRFGSVHIGEDCCSRNKLR